MPRRPPDALVYYLDANLDGPELVGRLREAGMRCEPHRDHFAPDAADAAWIPAIIYLNPDGQLRLHFGGARRGGRKKE